MSHVKKKKMVNKQPLEGLLVLEEVLMDALAKAPGTLVEAAVEVDMLAKLEQEAAARGELKLSFERFQDDYQQRMLRRHQALVDDIAARTEEALEQEAEEL